MRIITNYHTTEEGKNIDFLEVHCVHNETKPTEGVAMGSIAVESDTGDVYFYNETAGAWVKQFSFQG